MVLFDTCPSLLLLPPLLLNMQKVLRDYLTMKPVLDGLHKLTFATDPSTPFYPLTLLAHSVEILLFSVFQLILTQRPKQSHRSSSTE